MADPAPKAAAAAAATAPAPAPKKKGRTLLYVLTGVAVLLIGGGVAGYLALGSSGAHAKTAKVRPHAEPIYVPLDPPFVVNFETNGLVRFLQVTVQAMTEDPATAELVKRHDPMIRNSLLMLLSDQRYETLSSTPGKEQLRQAALAEIRKVVEKEGGKADTVKDLYFTSFVMQ